MSLAVRAWRALLGGLIILFVLNIGLMITAVLANSFARRWPARLQPSDCFLGGFEIQGLSLRPRQAGIHLFDATIG